jgi:hypothetical protein
MQRFLDEQNLRHDTTLQGIADTENSRTNLDFNNQLTTELNDGSNLKGSSCKARLILFPIITKLTWRLQLFGQTRKLQRCHWT